MKKIKLENLKISSFVTSLDTNNSKTIKGGDGNLSDAVPVCNTHESVNCTGGNNLTDCGPATACGCAGTKSLVHICTETNNAKNCSRSGDPAGGVSQMGCTNIC